MEMLALATSLDRPRPDKAFASTNWFVTQHNL